MRKDSGGGEDGACDRHVHSFLLSSFSFDGGNVWAIYEVGTLGIRGGEGAVGDKVAVEEPMLELDL